MTKRMAIMLLATTAALSLAACSSSTKATGPVTLPSISAVPPTASGPPSTADSSPSAATTTADSSPSASPSASTSASASASASASPSTGTVAGAACATSQLSVSLGQSQGAAGSQITPLMFTNTSSTMCTLSGYPGVSFVTGSSGAQVGAAATRSGGGGSVVSLATKATAQSLLKIVNTENYPAASCAPTDVRGLRVYPPGQKAALFAALPDGTTACSANGLNELSVQSVTAS